MSRLLFLAIIFVIVYRLLKSYSKQLTKEDNNSEQVEDMVRCVYCGVHLPKHESIFAEGKFYCCQSHRSANAETEKPK